VVLNWGRLSVWPVTSSDGERLYDMATSKPLSSAESPATRNTRHDVQLAMSNVSRFAGEGTATSTWHDHHAEAGAPQFSQVGRQLSEYQTRADEAFGDHFRQTRSPPGVSAPRAEIMAWYQATSHPCPAVIHHPYPRPVTRRDTRQLNSQI
jgi:hypothetical protein